MVKKWYGIEKLIDKDIKVSNKLYEYQESMEQIPNFDKSEGAKKVFERKEYIILRMKKGYIVYNQNKSFKEGHTHIRSYNVAKTIIDNCIKGKVPKTRNTYLLESHIRIMNDDKYINLKYIKLLKELIENNKTKEKYINEKVKK